MVGAPGLDEETQTCFSEQSWRGIPRAEFAQCLDVWLWPPATSLVRQSLRNGDQILPEMEKVPSPGSGQPVRGGEHLPAQSPAGTPGHEVSVAKGVQSTGVKKKAPHIENLAQSHLWLWAAAVNRSRGRGSLPDW